MTLLTPGVFPPVNYFSVVRAAPRLKVRNATPVCSGDGGGVAAGSQEEAPRLGRAADSRWKGRFVVSPEPLSSRLVRCIVHTLTDLV